DYYCAVWSSSAYIF
nr:immunoglobulin light chain junction region [Macaca mulatta]MOV67902.1 immunoglobulin light chain junction region [Macaca mulatta]MOV67964.1 immunoglobulin light chain junction region [Macaca mulatta]MOV69206.1 immunoglobulin light chain junction region [Macaca mulatta]MOV69630.1 immunoglobulin light chain junction region [Macaca mulatta]